MVLNGITNFCKSVLQFVPEGADRHSSSIMDLMDSCSSAYEFIQDLKWPDPIENSIFSTSLARVRIMLKTKNPNDIISS